MILDRNISIDEAKAIKEKAGIEVEMFLFGYLCYSQDSICYMGDYFCGEPCNVMCAQKVRINGKTPKRHFFMKYMSGLRYIPQLIDAGVDCVKIEGRQRSSDYVDRTTRVFREAIDSYKDALAKGSTYKIKKRWVKELKTAAFDFELTDAFYEKGSYKRTIIKDATLKNKLLYLYDCLFTFAETANTIKLVKELTGSIKLDWLTPPVRMTRKRRIDAFK